MKFTLAILSLLVLASCGGGTSSLSRTYSAGASSTETIDCSGYQSDMIIPYGLSTTSGKKLAGKKFAKLVAVDSLDGRMKISILPPDGASSFSTELLDELPDYTIRIIACRENPASVMSGFSTTGVCSSSGPINIVGKPAVESADFTSEGFMVNDLKVHATVSLIVSGTGYLKPNFIMITAGLVEQNQIGEFMIAYGRSPYYTGCYNR